MSINKWIKKTYIHTHGNTYIQKHVRGHTHTVRHYSVIKKEWNITIYSNIDAPRDYHTKWGINKSDLQREITDGITCRRNLFKNYRNELIYRTEIDPRAQRPKLWPLKGKGDKVGGWVGRYKLLYTKSITHGDLWCGTRVYLVYRNNLQMKRIWIYMHIYIYVCVCPSSDSEYIYIYIYISFLRSWKEKNLNIHTYMHIYILSQILKRICIYIYISFQIHTYICIHTHIVFQTLFRDVNHFALQRKVTQHRTSTLLQRLKSMALPLSSLQRGGNPHPWLASFFIFPLIFSFSSSSTIF